MPGTGICTSTVPREIPVTSTGMTVEESRAVVIMLDVALAVMARLDRAISINAMNRVIAQSGRAMTNGRRRVNVSADWFQQRRQMAGQNSMLIAQLMHDGEMIRGRNRDQAAGQMRG